MKIGRENRDSRFLLPMQYKSLWPQTKKLLRIRLSNFLNHTGDFSHRLLGYCPARGAGEGGGGGAAAVARKGSGSDSAMNHTRERSESACCTVPSMDMQLEMHSEELLVPENNLCSLLLLFSIGGDISQVEDVWVKAQSVIVCHKNNRRQ